MTHDLMISITTLLREHEENNQSGLTIDERFAERVLIAGRIIAAVRHHDSQAASSRPAIGRSFGFVRD